MLIHLEIDSVALIEHAEFDLGNGFQVLTGETGAGKSLLLGAIGAITGQTISRDLIRAGEDKAQVTAIFEDCRAPFQGDEEVLSLMEEGEDQLIVSREIRASGRNLCRVNAKIVPLALLRLIGDTLVDIHGQNDRQQIFRAEKHLSLLDGFGQEQILPLKQDYQRAWQALQELAKRERELLADPEERRLLTERLLYQINEIKQIAPKPGEDDELLKRRDLLANSERFREAISYALASLQGEGEAEGASEALAMAYSELVKVSHYEGFSSYSAQLAEASELVSDVISALTRHLDLLEARPGELEETDRRLDLITRLKRKYGGTIESVLDFQAKAEDRYARIEAAAEQAGQVLERKKQLLEILEKRGLLLREARQAQAARMAEAIGQELRDLGMAQAVFAVKFTEYPLSEAKAKGLENCEFLLSANRGEQMKPLANTASGGEASRIMLAIKVILAEADETPVLIFDEIDTGISGETTEVVALKLKKLSASHQILCVTHQAQIAAAADKQFLIYKESDDERTRTYVKPLDKRGREEELARLLSGQREDSRSLELARQLLGRHEGK